MGNVTAAKTPEVEFDPIRRAAVTVSRSDDYRVLSRIRPQSSYAPADGRPVKRALLVDSETTGLDNENDLAIEVCLLPFTFIEETGEIVDVLVDEMYVGLQEPPFPLEPKITRITGLTDEKLRGQRFDMDRIEALARTVNVVIAHHASFDRRIFERLDKEFAKKVWMCTQQMIPWAEEGVMGTKQEYIATSLGLFYDAHRAQSDCEALLYIMAQPLPRSDRMPLSVMINEVRRPLYAVQLPVIPFKQASYVKQDLFRLGYHFPRDEQWNDQRGQRSYMCMVTEENSREVLRKTIDVLARVNAGRPSVTEIAFADYFTRRAACIDFRWPEPLEYQPEGLAEAA